jgi:hypothetical protein
MNNTELNITSLDELKAYSQGAVVELPPFAEDMPFVAKIRRPSMLVLAKSGKIPNELLKSANELFYGNTKTSAIEEPDSMKNLMGIFDTICEACFVEPTWNQLKEAGIELTDEQYTFIFNYTQNGVKSLKSFRKEQTGLRPNRSKQNVQKNTK